MDRLRVCFLGVPMDCRNFEAALAAYWAQLQAQVAEVEPPIVGGESGGSALWTECPLVTAVPGKRVWAVPLEEDDEDEPAKPPAKVARVVVGDSGAGAPVRGLDRQALLARAASAASKCKAFWDARAAAPVRSKISKEVRSIRRSSPWRRGPVRSREPAVATPPWKARRL